MAEEKKQANAQEEEPTKEIPSIQAFWFLLILVSGILFTYSWSTGWGGGWVLFPTFILIVLGFAMATRIWVRHNPRKQTKDHRHDPMC